MARRSNISYIFGADISGLEKAWKRIDRGMRNTAAQFERAGKTMTKAFTIPIAAIGGIATKAALDTDKAVQAIARGTGAQGEALKSLEQEWRKLAVTVTQNFEESAKVLADYNTRLGLTGKALRDLSKQALDASRMMGEDVNTVVAESAKAMQDWGVEAEGMAGFMDRLFKAAQSTGIQMGTLSTQLYKYGAALRGMGFDLESSVALLAQFEKQGVNVERIMGSLSMGLGRMAREGITDAEEAFRQLILEIQNAGNVTEATRLAIEVFGSRAGPDMALAIREGRFSIEELIATLREADGVIRQTAKSTDDFAEKWAKTKNSIMLALEPIGREILNIAESIMPSLQRASEGLAASIANMSDSSRKKIVELAGVLAVGGPLLIAISATINAVRNLGSVVIATFALANSPFALAVASVAGLIAVLKEFEKVQERLGRTPEIVKERLEYSERAAEIYYLRHGKYPLTAPEYEELEKIIDELIEAEREAEAAISNLGVKAQEAIKPIPEVAQPAALAVEDVAEAGERAALVYEELSRQIEALDALSQYRLRYEGAPLSIPGLKELEWDFTGLEEAQRIGQRVAEEWEQAKTAELSALNIINAIIDQVEYMGMPLEEAIVKLETMRESMVPLSDEWKHATDLIRQYQNEIDRSNQKIFDWGMQFQLWVHDLGKGLADAVVYARDLSDVLDNILKQLASTMLQKLIFGWLPFEKGGVISQGKVQPFASGGIINKPLIFPMANGAGLAGEAGPEAIMPLQRTSSGDLGVKAEGGGDNINVTMNINAVDARSFVEMLTNNRTVIESIVVNNISHRNGFIRRAIQEAI